MRNVFNKKQTKEKKESNFFIYAIREIILVVLGILIAVSINNWNENRKQNNELNQLLLKVKEDLKNDVSKIDNIFNHYENIKPVFEKVLKSEYTQEDYIKNPNIAFLIFGYPELAINQRGISQLENFRGEISQEKEELVQKLILFYKEQLWEIQVDDELRSKDYKDNFNYWKNNTEWWLDYVQLKINNEFIEYAINSKDYKNRVATADFFAYKVYLPELEKFKQRGLELINEIEVIKQ
ncbi:DUF6090 family protein [uncultured Aquimarina sp.]|uniref:DUF6090 family protein n=1 Tax=uncultured Aquimarina sp. TaxID=575652 RepID=UPI002608E6C0|nr:DUF6090 family protein [uncultured Aquimarina sp.]